MSEQDTVILVDGSSYLYRAFHALPPLTTSKGMPTNAVRGVISMIRKLVEETGSNTVAIVFDAKGKTFRNDIYKEYKANRPPMPDDLRCQIEPLHALVRASGFCLISVPGVEADDVIGTLAKIAESAGRRSLISTGDKDMAQLVGGNTTLINTMNQQHMDADAVMEKFGVRPDQIIDYLALVGDTSDNIPGVPSCGPKTAAKWLATYGTMQEVINHADDIKGKIGEKLRASIEFLPMSYDLATIRTDVSLEHELSELVIKPADKDALKTLYTELEFKSMLTDLDREPGQSVASATGGSPSSATIKKDKAIDRNYETVLDSASFKRWIQKLKKAELIAFDTETDSLDYMSANLVGVSFAVNAGEAAYVPIAHDYEGAPKQLSLDAVLKQLKPLLEDPDVSLVGQNLKYDANVLHKYGIELRGIAHDTMLQSYVLNSTGSRHDMDSLAMRYLDETTIHYEDVAGKGKKQLTFNQIDIETASPYAAEDADITLRLHQALWPQLEQQKELKALYEDIEIPLVSVLSRVECNGVRINAKMMKDQSDEFAIKLEQLKQDAYKEAGREFNLSSPKQIQEIFFVEKEFPVIAKTPKGQPSTAENVMVQLAAEHDLPRIILEYRSLTKLKTTYLDKLPLQINSKTDRIHTSYHQAVASTGRLSSSDPNLQNIPIRTEEGRRIREAFIPAKGYRLMAADYSQIELRIMAHLSGDAGLLEAFAEGKDIHRATASEVFDVAVDSVEDDQRRAAKAINFGLIYGMSAFGLAKQLDIKRHEAQAYIDVYFARYPGVREYMDSTRESAKEAGFVETVFGRRLYLPDINARNGQLRQYAERTAINAPMQGTAADIIKRAMLATDSWLKTSATDARIIMQVHDELVLEVKAGEADVVAEQVRKLMTDAAELRVPLEVDIGIGNSWQEAH